MPGRGKVDERVTKDERPEIREPVAIVLVDLGGVCMVRLCGFQEVFG